MTRKILIGTTFVAAVVLVIAVGLCGWFWDEISPTTMSQTQQDILKSLFSFGLVTIIGGLLTIYLNLLKDEEEEKRAYAKELEDLQRADDKEKEARIDQIARLREDTLRKFDVIYRDLKLSKRTLRSRAERDDHGALRIEKVFFETTMDSLCRTELALEQMRQVPLKAGVLFKDDQAKLLLRGTRYLARYLHDVFEDFERNKVIQSDGHYEVPVACFNLSDFLNGRDVPDPVRKLVERMNDPEKCLSDRWQAFMEIESLRDSEPRGVEGMRRRYRTVAQTCATLVSLEMRANPLTAGSQYEGGQSP